MRARWTILLLLFGISTGAHAGADIDVGLLSQTDFRTLNTDLTASFAYKALFPLGSAGAGGPEFGLEIASVTVAHPDVWATATGGTRVDTLVITKLRIHQQLAPGFDMGGYVGTVSDSNMRIAGAEVRLGLLRESGGSPSVALRASYSQVSGIDQLQFETYGAELTAAKSFGAFTPYLGAGQVWSHSRPDSSSGLTDDSDSLTRYYAGAHLNLGQTQMSAEFDRTGEVDTVSLRLGVRI